MELERVLTKLRYDESVRGYALFTNDGEPFLSFSLPEETLPVIRGTMKIHSKSLKLMNVMTGEGTVVLARVDSNWVLGVLFIAEESLGGALQKTSDVIQLLGNTELPPPPTSVIIPDSEDEASTEVHPPETQVSPPDDSDTVPLETINVRHGCIVHKDDRYSDAMRIDSPLYLELKKHFANIGMDILMMVDEKRTVAKIAQTLDRSIDRTSEIVRWCVSRHIVRIECPEEQTSGQKEIIELPVFEGDLSKVKKEHRAVIELCDGNRTLHEIADMLGMLYFQALQCLIPYRGKTVRFIQKAK